jgi:hypothetical protein
MIQKYDKPALRRTMEEQLQALFQGAGKDDGAVEFFPLSEAEVSQQNSVERVRERGALVAELNADNMDVLPEDISSSPDTSVTLSTDNQAFERVMNDGEEDVFLKETQKKEQIEEEEKEKGKKQIKDSLTVELLNAARFVKEEIDRLGIIAENAKKIEDFVGELSLLVDDVLYGKENIRTEKAWEEEVGKVSKKIKEIRTQKWIKQFLTTPENKEELDPAWLEIKQLLQSENDVPQTTTNTLETGTQEQSLTDEGKKEPKNKAQATTVVDEFKEETAEEKEERERAYEEKSRKYNEEHKEYQREQDERIKKLKEEDQKKCEEAAQKIYKEIENIQALLENIKTEHLRYSYKDSLDFYKKLIKKLEESREERKDKCESYNLDEGDMKTDSIFPLYAPEIEKIKQGILFVLNHEQHMVGNLDVGLETETKKELSADTPKTEEKKPAGVDADEEKFNSVSQNIDFVSAIILAVEIPVKGVLGKNLEDIKKRFEEAKKTGNVSDLEQIKADISGLKEFALTQTPDTSLLGFAKKVVSIGQHGSLIKYKAPAVPLRPITIVSLLVNDLSVP